MATVLKTHLSLLLSCIGIFSCFSGKGQPVTGFWKGKIDHKNVELKIVKNGDSLTGTSYYYTSAGNFRRYSIRGYFDPVDNSVIWWDDQLIEEKGGGGLLPGRRPVRYISSADFNCPGGTKMYLTGKAALTEKPDQQNASVDLEKFLTPFFHDEWDYVIDNYTAGANDPYLIDSIGSLAFNRPVPAPVTKKVRPKPLLNEAAVETTQQVFIPAPVETTPLTTHSSPAAGPVVRPPQTNEQKLRSRSRRLVEEIPVTGDSIELRFYDNAEIDGDSIAVFLNDKMLAQHIRLSDTAFVIKLPVAGLRQTNDLVMVAENLGSIPPNTSLMIAMVAGKRYEARLASTEQTSALIRFVRKDTPSGQSANSR